MYFSNECRRDRNRRVSRNENIYVSGAKCRTKSRGRYHSHDWPFRRNHGGDNKTKSRGGNELTRQRDNIMGGSNMRRKDEIMVRPETVML